MELISSANGMSPAWSPDGAMIAFLSNRAEGWDLYVVSSEGGEPARLTAGATADGPAWRPDGEAIAVERGGNVELLRPDGSERAVLVGEAYQPDWHADGRLAFVRDGDLWVRAVEGEESQLLVDASEPAWSADGRQIAVVRHGGIESFDMASGETRALTDTRGDHAPAWSASGDGVAFARQGVLLRVADGGGEAIPIAGLPSPADAPAYAPAGCGPLLAFHLHEGGNWNVAIADLRTGGLRLLTQARWISWNARA